MGHPVHNYFTLSTLSSKFLIHNKQFGSRSLCGLSEPIHSLVTDDSSRSPWTGDDDGHLLSLPSPLSLSLSLSPSPIGRRAALRPAPPSRSQPARGGPQSSGDSAGRRTVVFQAEEGCWSIDSLVLLSEFVNYLTVNCE